MKSHNLSCQIVIVNYNSGEYLSRLIDSIHSTGYKSSITVVDNHSSDTSMEQITRLKVAGITSLLNETNRGFAAAANQGARESDSEFIVFLNPDCLMSFNVCEALVGAMKAPDYGIVGCRTIDSDGKEQRGSRRNTPTVWRSLMTFSGLDALSRFHTAFTGVNQHRQPLPNRLLNVDAISGACFIIRRSLFDRLNGFDEHYFMHCEDLDLCFRVISMGYRVMFAPAIEIMHYQGICTQSAPVKTMLSKHRGMLRYYHLHVAESTHRLVRWIVPLAIQLRMAVLYVLYQFRRNEKRDVSI